MKSIENLVKAFLGESAARNRYTIFAKVAREEGYIYISKVFLETAENEKEHAETLIDIMRKLGVGDIDVNVDLNLSTGSTLENLKSAAEGERYEWTEMYPRFAEIAESEGFGEVAERLRAIAKAEEFHERRFRILLEELEKGEIFEKDEETAWICLECGYVHYGKRPPERCPSCGHPRSYYVSVDLLRRVLP